MVSLHGDQAAGLRELFAASEPQPLALSFAGVSGRGALLAHLARALAAAGKEVLILDEQAGVGNLAAAFGLRSRYDLMQAVQGDVAAQQVVMQPEPAIRLVAAARAARRYTSLDETLRAALQAWLKQVQQGADVVLVETALRSATPILHAQRLVVCVSPDGADLKTAYAQIKQLERIRMERIGIVVLRAEDENEAHAVFERLQEVASRHLGIELDWLGRGAVNDRDIAVRLAGQLLEGAAAMPSRFSEQQAAAQQAARRRTDASFAVV